MAQKYNPATGQWEEDEEDGSLSGGSSSVFGGSSTTIDSSPMLPGSGGFTLPQTSMSGLPQGYTIGDDEYLKAQGITKLFDKPDNLSYSLMKGDQNLGTGYVDYGTGITNLAQKLWSPAQVSAASLVEPWRLSPEAPGMMMGLGGGDQGAGWEPLPTGMVPDPNLPVSYSPYTYDSLTKYGSALPLREGQLQNTFALLSSPIGADVLKAYGGVPDWTYGRAGYEAAYNPVNGIPISGANAFVGSTPVFGADGTVVGYRQNFRPEHANMSDTSGRTQSSSFGATTLIPGAEKFIRPIDDNYGFIGSADVDKFPGYTSYGSSSYNRSDSMWESLVKKAVPALIMGAAGAGLSGLFSGGTALGSGITAGGTGLGASATGGLGLTGTIEGLGSMGFGGSTAAGLTGTGLGAGWGALTEGLGGVLGAGGLGLEGLPGLISDLGASFPGAFGNMAGGAVGDLASSLASNPFSGGLGDLVSSFGNSNAIPGFENLLTDQVASPSFSPSTEALSQTSLNGVAPDGYSPLDGVDPFETTDMVNKGWNRATGYGLDNMYGKNAFGIPTGTAQEIKNMYNFMTQSPGKAGMFKAPSPLEMLYKGGKAFMDYRSNKDAMGMYEDQLNKVREYNDPNRARGDFANQAWQQNFQNPMAGYKDFMMGGGREFIDQARAAAAKGGKRGSYINSGKMNSDLAGLYMKNQLQRGDTLARGFERGVNSEENAMRYMAPLMEMKRNEYAPFGQAIDSIMRGFQLSDLFGG